MATFTVSTQSEWNNGTLTDTDADFSPGTIRLGSEIDYFEDGNIDEYTQTTAGQFQIISTGQIQGGFAVKSTQKGPLPGLFSTTGLNDYPAQGDTFTARHWIGAATDTGDDTFTLFGFQDSNNYYNVYIHNAGSTGDQELVLRRLLGGSNTELDSQSVALGTFPSGEWLTIQVDWTDPTITATLFDSSDTQLAQVSANDTNFTSGGFGLDHAGGGSPSSDVRWDAIRIRPTSGTYTSEWHNWGLGLETETLEVNTTLNSQTVNYTVRVSDDNGATTKDSTTGSLSDGFNSIDLTGLDRAQYVQVEYSLSTGTATTTPVIQDYNVITGGAWEVTTQDQWKGVLNRTGFTDNFDDATLKGTWSQESGTWTLDTVNNGVFLQTATGGDDWLIRDQTFDDVWVRATIDYDTDRARLVLRWIDSDNLYFVHLSTGNNKMEIRRISSGTETIIATQTDTISGTQTVKAKIFNNNDGDPEFEVENESTGTTFTHIDTDASQITSRGQTGIGDKNNQNLYTKFEDWSAATLSTGLEADTTAGDIQPGYKNGVTGNGLIGFYRLNETATGTVNDNSGNGNDLSTNNFESDEFVNGILGTGAFDFDDDYVSGSAFSALAADSDHSISLWVNLDSTTDGQILDHVESGGDRFSIYVDGGTLRSRVFDGTTSHDVSGSISTGAWVHVAVVWDSSANDITLYLDNSAQTGTDTSNDSGETGTFFGSNSNVGGTPRRFLDGTLDEIRIYNSALSASQVTALFEGTDPLTETFGGTYESEWHDWGVSSNLNEIGFNSTLNSQTIDYTVRVSDDNGATTKDSTTGTLTGGTEAVDLSALSSARYAQVQLDTSTTTITASPTIQDFTVTSTELTAQVFLALTANDILNTVALTGNEVALTD